MDALAYMFSIARKDSSNELEFKPEWIMQEDLMSLSSKFPLIPGSQRSITFCTTPLSQKVSNELAAILNRGNTYGAKDSSLGARLNTFCKMVVNFQIVKPLVYLMIFKNFADV